METIKNRFKEDTHLIKPIEGIFLVEGHKNGIQLWKTKPYYCYFQKVYKSIIFFMILEFLPFPPLILIMI